ncbi:MAG: PorP/SprF family type IX secretion system membrane protein [Bacteroidetes bacterium]|nr:PorP/SprF family type IX secretion system membrane protein [Bacteroidota bacterium]
MKKIKTNIVLILVLSVYTINTINAQDVHFTQFYNSPLTLNPANTGVFNGNMRFIANYKDQWGKVTNPYKTYGFSYDAGLLKQKWANGYLGFGLSFFNDKAGDSKLGLTQVNLSASCLRILDRNNSISAGIQGGLAQRSFTANTLTWDNQYNGLYYDSAIPADESFNTNAFYYSDYSAGVLWTYKKNERFSTSNNHFYANFGGAVLHINKPHQTFFEKSDNLNRKYVFHGGLTYGLNNTKTSIIPGFLAVFQGTSKEITFGSMIKREFIEASHYTGFIKNASFYFGGYYRWSDAILLSAQLEIFDWLLGVSYDINVSKLKSASYYMGGLEISVRYIYPLKVRYKSKF